MTDKSWMIELLKLVVPPLASVALAYIGVLKNRTDLDRFAARQRAKESGLSVESQMRRRWYHGRRNVKIEGKDFGP